MVRFANIYTLLNKYGSLKSSLTESTFRVRPWVLCIIVLKQDNCIGNGLELGVWDWFLEVAFGLAISSISVYVGSIVFSYS